MLNLSFCDLAGAVVAAYSGHDKSFASWVQFWGDHFGTCDIATIKIDNIEDGIDALI